MIKKEHIKHLKEMNAEAEKLVRFRSYTVLFFGDMVLFKLEPFRTKSGLFGLLQKSYSVPIGLDLQKRYATTVLDLEQLNKDLNKVLHEVQQFCYEVCVSHPL